MSTQKNRTTEEKRAIWRAAYYKISKERKKQINARRTEKYKNDAEYREKRKACVKRFYERNPHLKRGSSSLPKAVRKLRRDEWNKKNPEKMRSYILKWYHKNKPRVIALQVARRRVAGMSLLERLASRCRSRMNAALKRIGAEKSQATMAYVGCSVSELRDHLQARFKDGMTWENRSEWQIDHKTPLASAKTVDAMIPLLHFSNLQPLWARDNRKKWAKMPEI